MKKHAVWGIAALFGMLLLVLAPATGLSGAKDGLQLCINVVIPSLFPFFFLSAIVRCAFAGCSIRPLRSLGRALGIPSGFESILILSLFGGYPIGAQTVATAWKEHQISTASAKRLLGFCSNAGPSFIFGMLGSVFQSLLIPWLLWFVHILSSLLVGFMIGAGKNRSELSEIQTVPRNLNVQSIIKDSIQAMCIVCGWVILFRILIAFLGKWLLEHFPTIAKIALSGILELTNGCLMLSEISSNASRFILSSVLLAFGGLCVCLQTLSITGRLGIKTYLQGKLLQGAFSFILSWIVCLFLFPAELNLHWIVPAAICVMTLFSIVLIRRKNTNKYGNYAGCDV